MTVICWLVFTFPNGYRDHQPIQGVVINDESANWTVDFTADINRKKLNKAFSHTIRKVQDDACTYVETP